MPHHRTIQGHNHPTFYGPPLDGSLAFPALFEYNAHHSPHHTWIRYADEDVLHDCHDISWSQGIKAIRTAAYTVTEALGRPSTPMIVAILAATDSITYVTMTAGIMGSNNIPFPISQRNSPPAVAHLLRETKATALYVSRDPGMQTLANLALKELEPELAVTLLVMPTFHELYEPPHEAPPLDVPHYGSDTTGLIMHSSGTTRFPSPIHLSQRYLLFFGISHEYGEVDLCGLVLSFHASPMFHLLGLYCLMGSVTTGYIVSLFAPCEGPPAPSTPSRVLEAALATRTDFLVSVPLFIEEYSKSEKDIEAIKNFKALIYAGAPIAKHVGDKLSAQGIKLFYYYGSTECWVVTMNLPKSVAVEGWEWIPFSSHVTKYLIPFEGVENVYRLIIGFTPGLLYKPAVLNSEIDGKPVYDTKDLIVLHPTNSNLFRVYGRFDEQIMHSSGEKTNPIPIEAILCKDEKIRGAIMFGRGKFQPGVLVIPSAGYEIDSDNMEALKDFRASIWNTVELANMNAPQHSRIFKEMIIVEKPSKPIEFTAKGAPRRPTTIVEYAPEIEALYAAVDRLAQLRTAMPASLEAGTIKLALASFVRGHIHADVPDDGDIFAYGADSLVATAIRNYVIGILNKAGTSASVIRSLPGQFVFDHSTIRGLSELLYDTLKTAGDVPTIDNLSQVPELPNLLAPARTGHTIVKIHDRPGETPLIVLHGGSGGLAEYSEWQTKFHTSVWGIQITPDAPLDTLQTLATFYVDRILENQALGPFKIAGYSASGALSVLVALELEKRGHVVERLIFLDTHPVYFAHISNTRENRKPTKQTGPQALNADRFVNMLKHDSSQNSARTVEQFFSSLTKTAMGESTAISRMVQGMSEFVLLTDVFTYELATDEDGVQSMGTLRRWVGGVKAPKTVYIATRGLKTMIGDGKYEDLGDADLCSRVVHVDGGHWEFLWNPDFLEDIQKS